VAEREHIAEVHSDMVISDEDLKNMVRALSHVTRGNVASLS